MASLAELTVSIVGDVSNVRKAFADLDQGVAGLGNSMSKLGNDMKSMGTSLSLYVTAPLVAIGAGMSSMAMNFESEMLKVKAVTGATDADIAKLSQTALQLGADTVFGATDAAEAMVYFGQAGYNVDQIMDATGDTLYLAAAAELELGHAADIVTDILAGYGMGATEAGHVTDVLAQTAADTKAEIAPMGEAFSYVGALAHQMGWSIEETSAVLGQFAQNGFQGERAGTALRGAITELISPTQKTVDIFAKYGLTMEDVNPATHDFADILDIMNAKGISTADTMAIFGDRAGPAMLAALQSGSDAIRTETTLLYDCKDAAKNMADTMMSGSKGGLEDFKGSIETLAISMGTLINEYLDPILGILAKVADAFNTLPGPVKMLVLLFAALAAAVGPVLLVAGTLIGSIGTITTAIAGAGGLSAVLTAVVGILTGPVAIAIAAFAAAAYIIYKNWDTVGPLVQRTFDTIVNAVRPTAEVIMDFVNRACASLGAWWNTNGPAIAQAVSRVGEVLGAVFGAMAAVIWYFTSGPLKGLWEAFQQAVNIIIPILQYIGQQVGNMVMLVVNLINGNWSGAWTNARNIVSAAWEAIKSIVSGGLNAILGFLVSVLNSIYSTIQNVWNSIRSYISGAMNAVSSSIASGWNNIRSAIIAAMGTISTAISGGWNAIRTLITGAMSQILTAVTSGWNNVRTAVTNAMNNINSGISTGWNTAKTVVSNGVSGIVSTVSSFGSSLYTAGANLVQSVINGIASKIQDLKNKINELFNLSKSSDSGSSSGGSGTGKAVIVGEKSGNKVTGISGSTYNTPPREKHDTGGIAGYTGWHWMERGELAIPQQTNWDQLLVKPIVRALTGSSSGSVSAGNVIIQNMPVTLTSGYNFEQLMSDIEKYNSQKRFQRGISL